MKHQTCYRDSVWREHEKSSWWLQTITWIRSVEYYIGIGTGGLGVPSPPKNNVGPEFIHLRHAEKNVSADNGCNVSPCACCGPDWHE